MRGTDRHTEVGGKGGGCRGDKDEEDEEAEAEVEAAAEEEVCARGGRVGSWGWGSGELGVGIRCSRLWASGLKG